MPLRAIWMLSTGALVCYACYWRADHSPYARFLAYVFEQIDEHYLERVDEEQLFDAGVAAMVGRLDRNSQFISRDEAAHFQQSLDQRFGGIGVEVRQDPETKRLVVATPVLNSPAYRAGIQAGDAILAIDGQPLDETPPKQRLAKAVRLLQGAEGEPVVVRYERPGEPAAVDVTLKRAIIQVDSVLGDTRKADNSWDFSLARHEGLGYVRIATFGEQTVAEVAAALESLRASQCKGLILDLRDNRGGLLRDAPEICDMFLPPAALIVSTRDRSGKVQESYLASGDARYLNLPLVVLVNNDSASASEIVAAAMQDHHRARIVGERTWGKGTVQHVIPVEGGLSRLRLTTSSYWRPNGQNIHRFQSSKDQDPWGVRPDAGCGVVMGAEERIRWMAERRKREVVWPPGSRPKDAADFADAADFDPAIKRAVELLDADGAAKP